MEITGKAIKLTNYHEGTSAKGAWRKVELIIETQEQYPKNICLQCWNEQCIEAEKITQDQIIKANVYIESREFNGKYYTDVKVVNFIGEQRNATPLNHTTAKKQNVEETDDLPF